MMNSYRISLLLVCLALKASSKSVPSNSLKLEKSCSSPIYCYGDLLETVQMARIYNDSKSFVDCIMKNSVENILSNFDNLMDETKRKPTKEQIKLFVDDNFYLGEDIVPWTPPDYKEKPKFLEKISDSDMKHFAQHLVKIWPTLGRKVSDSVIQHPEQHSLIAVPNGFIIPGGRFREIYYWDTYWIIKGLLLSEMTETVKGMLDNFVSFIERYGFIPNGSRVYYLNRSQPPLFALMVAEYIKFTNDTDWLSKNINFIENELQGWLDNRIIEVKKDGHKYKFAHYDTKNGSPRPESYYEDKLTCNFYSSEEEKKQCYSELKSGAESGWDFSSRWIVDSTGSTNGNISNIQTSRIIPVDLNAFLCRSFLELSNFYKLLNQTENAQKWLELSTHWQKSLEKVLYNKQDGVWYDYDVELLKQRKYFFPSNLAPLWTESYNFENRNKIARHAVKYLKKQNIDQYPGGIPTSLDLSGEQWDLPNAWPPLQEIVILGLSRTGYSDAVTLADQLARTWIEANMIGYSDTKEMFEKYDAEEAGKYGGGGEYTVQSGFGWTNGVVLSLINIFFSEK